MNIPTPSTPPRNRLIIPGAPAEQSNEPEAPISDDAPMEHSEAEEPMLDQEAYEESPQEPVAADEFIEQAVQGDVDEVEADVPAESAEDDFLMVDHQQPEEQGFEQAVQADTPPEIAATQEPKTVRRLLPRGAVDDETAPAPRRFSSFQTAAVSVGTGHVPHSEQEMDHEAVQHLEEATVQAKSAADSPAVQQYRAVHAQAKRGLPTWIFSMIGFLFGVLTVLFLVKLGLMPAALGLTDQKSLRDAVKGERARIIKILEEDDVETEDWDNFVEEKEFDSVTALSPQNQVGFSKTP